MNLQHIPSKDFTTANWSGGTTTELFIYPKNANYKARDFDFRISTATVAIETSVFTPLEDVSRTLLVLDGVMALNHKGKHESLLSKFDVDQFNGGWETHSKGQCIDFNLMTRGKTQGNVSGHTLTPETSKTISIKEDFDFYFLYLYKGNLQITIEKQKYELASGDLFIVKKPSLNPMLLRSKEGCEFVITTIS